MSQHPVLLRKAAAFLPNHVPLGEWIEQRIGGEIELRPGAGPGLETVIPTPAARASIAAKYQELKGSVVPPVGTTAGPPKVPGVPPVPKPAPGMQQRKTAPPPAPAEPAREAEAKRKGEDTFKEQWF